MESYTNIRRQSDHSKVTRIRSWDRFTYESDVADKPAGLGRARQKGFSLKSIARKWCVQDMYLRKP